MRKLRIYLDTSMISHLQAEDVPVKNGFLIRIKGRNKGK